MLAIIRVDGIIGQEIRYLNDELNVLHNPWEVINEGEHNFDFVWIIDDHDYISGMVDRYLEYLTHEIVSRYRTKSRINKDATVPFTRHCEFLIFPEASTPINYTVEYRADYEKCYITDDILEELKNETT